MTPAELRARIDTIERCYEFFLAFAAQGVRDDRQSQSGGQLRDLLGQMADALRAIPEGVVTLVEAGAIAPADAAGRIAKVVEQDAGAALAAVELVLGQERIGSQMVDNLNATIHVRALLTDLFLLDEVLAD